MYDRGGKRAAQLKAVSRQFIRNGMTQAAQAKSRIQARRALDWILVHLLVEILWVSSLFLLPFITLWNVSDILVPDPALHMDLVMSIFLLASFPLNGALIGFAQALVIKSFSVTFSLRRSVSIMSIAWAIVVIIFVLYHHFLTFQAQAELVILGVLLGIIVAIAEYILINMLSKHRLFWALTYLFGYSITLLIIALFLSALLENAYPVIVVILIPVPVMIIAILTALQNPIRGLDEPAEIAG